MDIRRRRALQLGVGSTVAATLPFPSSLTYVVSQSPEVALVMKSLANEFFLTVEDGAHKHQKDHASEYSLLTNGTHDETNTAGQTRLVEWTIVVRVDALVPVPTDSKTLVPVVKRAVDTDVLVISINNRLDPAALKEKGLGVPFVRPDNRKSVRLVDGLVTKSLKSSDAAGIVEGIPTTTNAQQCTTSFKGAAEAAKLKIAGVQSGEWEIDKGNKVAAAMLRSEPNLEALLCGDDNVAIGVVSAVRAVGKLGKALTGSYDNIDVIRAMLVDGHVVATADRHVDQRAVYGIEAALKALAFKTPRVKLLGVVEIPVNLVARS